MSRVKAARSDAILGIASGARKLLEIKGLRDGFSAWDRVVRGYERP